MNKVEQPQPRSAKAFSQGEQRAVMNVARNAFPETDIEFGIAALATRENVLSPRLEQPPTYGDSQREAITAIFTSMTEQVGHDLNQLRAKIDDLEQLMLTNASKVKADMEQSEYLPWSKRGSRSPASTGRRHAAQSEKPSQWSWRSHVRTPMPPLDPDCQARRGSRG